MVGNAADGRNEQHACRHVPGKVLCVVPRAAWHARMLSRSMALGRSLQSRLNALVHHRRRALAQHLYLGSAWPGGVRSGHELEQLLLLPLEDRDIGITDLEQHLGLAGDDARRAGEERDAPGCPYAAWSGNLREDAIDLAAQLGKRQASVLANGH